MVCVVLPRTRLSPKLSSVPSNRMRPTSFRVTVDPLIRAVGVPSWVSSPCVALSVITTELSINWVPSPDASTPLPPFPEESDCEIVPSESRKTRPLKSFSATVSRTTSAFAPFIRRRPTPLASARLSVIVARTVPSSTSPLFVLWRNELSRTNSFEPSAVADRPSLAKPVATTESTWRTLCDCSQIPVSPPSPVRYRFRRTTTAPTPAFTSTAVPANAVTATCAPGAPMIEIAFGTVNAP